MKKIYLFLLLCCLNIAAFGQTTVTVFGTGTGNSGYVTGTPATGSAGTLTRTTGTIMVQHGRSTAIANAITRKGYAVFDLSNIPRGSTVSSVTYGWYVSSYTAGTASGNYYIYGFAGDLSQYTNAQSLLTNIVKSDSVSSGVNCYLYQTSPSPGFGTAVGNVTASLATNFFTKNIGSKVSICMEQISQSTATTPRIYTITGESGSTASTTTSGHAPYLTITYTAASACSGTPSAGAAAASVHAANSTTGITLDLTGASTGDSLAYQWQSSTTSATAGFSNISGATNRNYSFTSLSSKTYYQCIVTCTAGGGGGSSTSTVDSIVTFATSSCTPYHYYQYYCNYYSTSGWLAGYTGVGPVKLVGDNGVVLRDSTLPSPTSYTDKTSDRNLQGCTLYKTYTHTITFRPGAFGSMVCQVWIDYNNDGTFQNSETVGGGGITANTSSNISLSAIPGTVTPGYYRMRVVLGYSSYQTYPFNYPCPTGTTGATFYYGETRDYLVNVINPPPTASASPSSLAFAPTTTSTTSAALSTALTGSFLLPTTGTLTVTAPSNFQVSPDGTTWGNSYTFSYSSGGSSSTVYVDFSPTAVTTYSGNVAVTGGGLASAYNIPVTGNGASACSGTPTAGTASTSPSIGGSSVSFTLTDAGFTSAGGLGFQWQKFSGGSWVNVSGATNFSYTFSGLTATTKFQCVVTCISSGLSATTAPIIVYYLAPSSCTPAYYYNASTYPMPLAITARPFKIVGDAGTTLLDANNPNPTGSTGAYGYTDATATTMTCTMTAGNTYTATAAGSSSYTMSEQVWIDFNNDGTFQSSESVGGAASGYTLSPTFSLTIPTGSALSGGGIFRMRAIAEYNYHVYPNINPCPNGTTASSFYYGEIRDYLVTINVPPTVATVPAALSFGVVTSSTTSSPLSAALTGVYLTPATGSLTVTAPSNYEISPDGSTWYSTSYTISYTASTLGASSIYVRFDAPATTAVYTGNVVVSGGGLSTSYNLAVNGTSAPACSGTVTGGTTVGSPSSATSSSTFVLSLSGATLATGLQYQWMQSSTGTGGWTNISGATNSTDTITGISANTYYYCLVYCPASGSAVFSSVLKMVLYCTPAFYYSTSCSNGMIMASAANPFKIIGASGTSITDGTLCNGSNYKDQTGSYSVTLNAASTYNVTVAGSTSYSMSYQIWIDFNQDGTFDATESVGGVGLATGAPRTFTITIPAGSAAIAPGIYRMRVEGEYNYHAYPSLYSCPTGNSSLSQYYGDVRDYTVNLNVPPTAVVSPTTLAFAATTTGTTSAPLSATLTGFYLTPASSNLTVTAPSNFSVYDPTGAAWVSSYIISYTGGSVATTTIQAEFSPTAVTAYSGNITITGGGLSTTNIAVTGNGAAACSGTPTGGTTSCSPTTGNSSTAFTLTCTGYTSAGGIQFQWQSSPTGSSWTNITGATNSTYSFTGISGTTYYQCVVTCSYSSTSATSASTSANFFPASSCTPAYYYNASTYPMPLGLSTAPFRIAGVTTLVDANGPSSTGSTGAYGYTDNTATTMTCTLNAGTTYSVSTAGSTSYTMSEQIWIDFNNDGTFQSSESVGGASLGYSTPHIFNIIIPSGASGIAPGTFRMRAIAEYYYHTYPGINPCPNGTTASSFYYGDVRDYKVTINVPPTGVLAPTSLAFPATIISTSSAALTSTFTGSYLTPAAGNITVTAPSNFQVQDPSSSSWVTSYIVSYTGASYGATISVQFNPTAVTAYSGNVTITGGGLSTLNLPVTGNGAAPCSGTPTAGTTSCSPGAGNSTTAFTLTCSGYTVAGGIQFQWQSSPDASTWTNISGATNPTYTFTGISATTYYHCIVTCSISSSSATSASTTANWFPASSCTPAYYYNASTYPMPLGTSTYPFKVVGVTTLIDANGPSGTGSTGAYGYVDNTSTTMTCTMNAGTTYNVSAAGSTSYTMSEQMWIDFNNDGTFQTSESVGGESGAGYTSPHTFTITIPSASAGVAPGTYRMRAIAEYYYHTYPGINPCPNGSTASSYYYGDVRDYKVAIQVPPYGVASPTSITFPNTLPTTTSATLTTTFAANYLTPAAGNITVTAPANFQVQDPSSSSWVTSYVIAYTGSTIALTTINVNFTPPAASTYTGNLTFTGGGLTTVNVALSGNGSTACSGTPTAGSAVSTPLTGSSATTFVHTLPGATASGLSYQWQSASTIGGTYTAITGATNATYTVTGLTAKTFFNCIVTCVASGLSATSNSDSSVWVISTATPCTPAPSSASYACGTYSMSFVGASGGSVALTGASGSIYDNLACNSTGYRDRTALSCTLNKATSYNIAITFGGGASSYSDYSQWWIDFNGDGTFQSTESVGYNAAAFTSGYVTITIPATAPSGTFRMRGVCDYNSSGHSGPGMNPCMTGYSYGECRDYTVTLQNPGPFATVTPTTMNFGTIGVSTTSAAQSAITTAYFLSPSSGTLTVTAPTNYSVCATSGGTYSNSYTISYTGGTVSATSVFVKFNAPASTGTDTGTVVISGGGITPLGVSVTGNAATPCTGTPAAGTASATPTAGVVSTTFALSLSGSSVGLGMLYQWQSSTSGTAGTFSDVTGATNATYNPTGLTGTTFYQCNVSCGYSGITTTSNIIQVNVFCTPLWYYASSVCGYPMVVATSANHFRLNGVAGGINDSTACNTAAYVDQYATTSVTLNAGTTYAVTCAGSTSYSMSYQLWIDFNNDATFQTSESVGGVGGSTTSPRTFTIAIPSGTAGINPGTYRMRVIGEYNYHVYPNLSPCPDGTTAHSYYYGEGRDYQVTINVPPVATLTPTALTFPVTTISTTSSPLTSSLSALFLTPASGLLTVTAPANFQVLDPSSSTYVTSYSTSYTGGISSSTISVEFQPTAVTAYSGNVTITGGGLTSVVLPVSGNGGPICSGTPSAGTAYVTPGAGNATTVFTLIDTGYTSAGGLSYQWQSSSSATGTFTNISGATNSTYTFTGITANTYYQCIVTCTASGLSATTAVTSANFFPNSTCTPKSYYSPCSYGMTLVYGANHLMINGASGSMLNDSNACPGTGSTGNFGYFDETTTAGLTCTLNAGSTYTVTSGSSGTYSISHQGWIDFNNDGTFQTSESVGGLVGSASAVHTWTITLPTATAGVVPGTYRMRLEAEYNYHNYPNLNPCPDGTTTNSYYYLEVRDFKVNVQVPPTAVATPNPIPFPPTVVGGTASTSTSVLNASYLIPTSSMLTVTSSDPTNFQVYDPIGASWGTSYTVAYSSSTLSASSIQVQFTPSSAITFNDTIFVTGGGLTTYKIPVNGTGAGICSGTPTAGTASISPVFGNATTPFTLSVTGYTVAGGLAFQWQSSPDGATWTNISGATLSSYSFTGISATTYYQCIVACTASGLSATTSAVNASFFVSPGCTPTWYYSTGCGLGMTVAYGGNNFMVTGASGSISDGTACSTAGYLNLTATSMTCTLNAGSSYTFTTGSSASYSMSFQAWIDFNRNGTFESSESVGGVGGSAAAVHTFTVTIPSGASGITPGLCAMRVEGEYNYHVYPNLYVCPTGSSSLSQYYGEIRDYRINVQVPPTATATPSSIACTPTTVGSSSTANTTLNALYLTPSSGTLTVTSTNPAIFLVNNGTSYVTSYTYSYTGSTSSPYTINAQFTPTAAAAFTGTVTVTGGGLSTLNIPISGNGAAACSGTPTAGTASASPTFGGASTAFTLSLSGSTSTGGITYQWQSSPDATTWTNISGATTSGYSFTGITASTYYRCQVTCSYSSTTVATAPLIVNYLPGSSCTPLFNYAPSSYCGVGTATNHLKLNGASGSINDGTAASSATYTDQTASMGCTLATSSTYTMTLGTSSTSYAVSDQIWIDFNSNGTFESSEVVGGGSPVSTLSRTRTITIPAASAAVHPGTYRMRVEGEYSYHAYPNLNPCPYGSSGSYYYGEVRDYAITITANPVYSLTPSSLSFSPTLVGGSTTMTTTFTGSYLSPTVGTLTISAPANFKLWNGSSYVSSYNISYTGYTVPSTTITVQFNPTAATTYSGIILITGGGLGVVTMGVSGTGANMCTGTPTAGTASASPTSASSGTTVSLSLSGTSVVAGLTYQWQSSYDSSAWSNITGATNATYSFTGLSTTAYYRCVVGCSASGLSSTSNGAKVTWVMPTACTPSWIYASNACVNYTMGIGSYDLVGIIGAIHDAAACNSTGYYDRRSLSTTLLSGTTYVATIATNTASSTYNVNTSIWIDFNSDGTFQSSELVGGDNAWTGSGHTETLTIPAGVGTGGVVRMRVENEYNYHSYPSMDPCPNGSGTFYYGEVRDYTVQVVNPSTCSGTPSAGYVAATATSGCSPVASNLSLPAVAGVSGLTYQWQSSPDNTTWTSISGATASTYASSSTATTTTATTYYRCTITCTSSGGTSTSTVQAIVVSPSPGAITGTPVACIGGSTTLSCALTGGTWTSATTSVATVNSSTGVVYGVSAGSAVISYTTTGCSPATSSFTVNTSPASITGFTSLCVGGATTLHDVTTGGTWSSASTAIATVDPSSGLTTALSAGTTTITYSNGCGTPATISWTTNTSPSAIVGPSSICTLSTGTFTDTITGGTWSNSPTTVGSVDPTSGVFYASSTAGVSTLTYTIGYCSVTGTATVGITSPGSISGATAGCFGTSTTLTNPTTGGAWSTSDGTIASVNSSSGLVTGVSSGSATITYSTGCGTAATQSFTVNGSPVTITSTTACSQTTLNMTANTGAGSYTYSWSGPLGFTSTAGSPSISSAPTSASGIYSVTATQSGCSSSTSYWVRVDTAIQATVTALPASICPGSSSTITDAISSPVTGAYALTAIPYAPLTLSSVTSGPSGTGYSTVSLPFSFNFYGTSYSSVTLNTQGYINFGTPSYSFSVVSLPSSSAPAGMIAPFWHYMNAATGSIQYTTLGSAPNRKFVVRYNAVADYAGGGVNTAQIVLYETSNIIDMFISKANTTGTYTGVCGIQNIAGSTAVTVPGENGVNYSINNTVAGTGWRFARPSYTYAWSPATGLSSTTSVSPVATLTATSTYTVTVTDAYNGCTAANTAVGTVNVYNLPTAYAVTPSTGCTIGTSIGVANTETGVSYQLYRGITAVGTPINGTTGSSITFPSVTTAGTYTVIGSLITGGCQTTMTGSCVVNSTPTAFVVTGGSGCTSTGINIGLAGTTSGVSYQLYNSTSTVGSPITGTGSAISFGTFTAADVYTVTATSAVGGCTAAMTGSATIYTSPVAYTVTGGSGCTASCITVGTSNSESTASYQLYRGASTVGSPVTGSTGSGVTFGTQCTAGNYTVIATAGICSTTMNGVDTISTTPSISLGANPSVCQPTSASSISYSSATGSPTTYNISWGTTAITDGFTNVTGATLSGGVIPITIPSGAANTYTGSITVSNGFCTSTSYSFSITVYAAPAGSITSAAIPCMGYSTNIIFTGTTGATVAYQVNHGTTSTATLTGGTYTLVTSPLTTATTYTLVDVHNPVCSHTYNIDTIINPTPMQWVGGTAGVETDWNTAGNWTCGFVPGSGDDVNIPSGTTYSPVLGASATGSTRSLTVASGATVTLSSAATLSVAGSLTNSGSVTGAGTLAINGSLAQLIQGIGTVNNLTLNNSAGASIASASRVTVKGVLTISAGTLVTNDSLVLYSDTFATARLDQVPGSGASITGNTRVMQWIPGTRRAYRFWSHPFNSYIGLTQLNTYIDVTGAGGAANGFTTTASNAPSAYRYDPRVGNSGMPSDPGWRPYTSAYTTADSNRLHQYQGIRLFFRGAKGEGLGYLPYTPSSTTVAQTGTLNIGTQTVSLSKGSGANEDYNMVGNPYASPVDIGTIVYNAKVAGAVTGVAFYMWNPFLGSAGQFQPQSIPSGSATPYFMQANNCFQVRAAYDGATLTFAESNKGATATTELLKASSEYLAFTIYDANYHPWDMLSVRFDDAATNNEDNNYDATKPSSPADLNFYSLSAENHKLAIDGRPYKAEGIIPLGIQSNVAQDFIIKAENVAVPTGGKVYLHDKLLKQYVLLQSGTEYRFSITADKATQGEERFELSMAPANVASNKGLQVTMTPNPATDEVNIGFTNGKAESVSVRVLDLSGVSVYNQDLGVQQNGSVSVQLSSFASGIYMVELTSGSQKVVQRLVKE